MMEDTIEARLARIETKLDMALAANTDHEKRLRWLSNEAWLHRGGLATVGLILTKLGLPFTWHVG